MNIVEAQCTAHPPMIRNRFVVECADTQTLKATITRLRNIDSVFDAFRVTPGQLISVFPDFVGDAARSALKLLGGAEHEVEKHSPIEEPVHEAVAALHHAAESMDRHVEVLEAVAATLPELTGALVKLTDQLSEVLRLARPLEAAEREVAGIGRLFRRRRRTPAPAQLPAPPDAPAAAAPLASAVSSAAARAAPEADADDAPAVTPVASAAAAADAAAADDEPPAARVPAGPTPQP